MKKRIYLSSPHMSEEGYEMNFIKEAFDTNWIAPLGPNVDNFELEVSKKLNIKNAVALVSGTSAIHMALKLAGVQKDDVVLVQSLTFSATVNPILYLNAKPVFIDSDFKSWNMDPIKLEEALINYPNAKAVIVVHLYGFSADLDKITELCEKFKVILIEDAAESLGSKYKGKYTGTFGKYGVISFNGNKIITTSGGGMLLSNNKEDIDKVRFWVTQSRDKARHYQHSEIGFNYRMSNVVAGIGRGQLMVLDRRIIKKKYIYNYYKDHLSEYANITFMPINVWDEPNYWLTCILIKDFDIEKILISLEKNNIEARPIWKPMHLQPVFKEYDFIGTGISEIIFNNGICLPSDTKMNDDDLDLIIRIIKRTLKNENL